MAKRCIFCDKEFGLFGGDWMLCGDTKQPVCSNCSDILTPLSPIERAEKALETGRAWDAEDLQQFLDRERERQEQERARLERAHQAIRTDKTCLRCGGPMEKYGTKLFHLGEEGLLGPVARDGLFAAWLEAEVIRCAQCGMAEFYLPEPPALPNVEEEPALCSQCDTPNENPSPKQETGRLETKPPWEK